MHFHLNVSFLQILVEETGRNCFFRAEKNMDKNMFFFPLWKKLVNPGLCKKSLNMGPIFHEKILNYGSDFHNFPWLASEPRKILKIWCFVAKSQEMGTFFSEKIPKYWYLSFSLKYP